METLSRTALTAMLKQELGPSLETEMLIDRLWDMWETMDTLRHHLGKRRARRIVKAPTCSNTHQ